MVENFSTTSFKNVPLVTELRKHFHISSPFVMTDNTYQNRKTARIVITESFLLSQENCGSLYPLNERITLLFQH